MTSHGQSIDEEWMSFISDQMTNNIHYGLGCATNGPSIKSTKTMNDSVKPKSKKEVVNVKSKMKKNGVEVYGKKQQEMEGDREGDRTQENVSERTEYMEKDGVEEKRRQEKGKKKEKMEEESDSEGESGESDEETQISNSKNPPNEIETSKETYVPECDDLYISTKTKVVFLNHEIDINSVFWNIPIIEYWRPQEGIIKKQMKIVSNSTEEYEEYKKKLEGIPYYTENIIKQVDSRNKYKDERKITIGISKKDIMNCRGKIKNAFYNCFAMILRFYYNDAFKEIHVKVFNTGKMEIPGIFNTELLNIVKAMVLKTIQPFVKEELVYIETNKDDNVLINSNFNCGFFINREKLHNILKRKYGIETSFDPCSYPGVKCKFYFNNELNFNTEEQIGKIMKEDCFMKMSELGENKKYTEVSFMIFRTGSCLIVGNCSEKILKFIFEFVKKILMDEYENICIINEKMVSKVKKTKIRKRTITLSRSYYDTITTTCCVSK